MFSMEFLWKIIINKNSSIGVPLNRKSSEKSTGVNHQ